MGAPARGGEGRGGEGGRAGEREGEGGGGKATRILVLPSHRQPKCVGGGETSSPDLGAHLWVHTEAPPPPPPPCLQSKGKFRGGEQRESE